MKLAALPQSPIEWIALKANLMPIPLLQSQIAFVLSRAVLDAYQFDVFGACREGRKNLDEITKFTQLDKRALKSLLNVLIAAGYFNYTNGEIVLNFVKNILPSRPPF